MRHVWILVACAVTTLGLTANAVDVGGKVETLTFKDIRYVEHTFDTFKDKQVFVLYFTSSKSKQLEHDLPMLNELDTTNASLGAQLLIVNVGPDSILDMAFDALSHKVVQPVVKDTGGKATNALGVTMLGETAVVDKGLILRYRGGILGVKDAVAAALQGKDSPNGAPIADGQPIEKEILPSQAKVTFAEHVAPIVYSKCAGCHHPGTAAPFSLLNYDQVSSKAKTIARVVGEGQMPPWYAHPAHGQFANNPMLTAAEKEAIVTWASNGRETGDLAKAPQPPSFPDTKWAIGEPDLFTQAETPKKIPATGYIPYTYVTLPYIFPHDTWVQGIEIMPGNPNVVHHANLIFMLPGEKYNQATNFLTGKVPGGAPADLKDGTALRIPKGAQLTLQVHYVTTGKEEEDSIGVGLRFAKEPIRKRVRYKIIGNTKFEIAPNDMAYPVKSEKTLECDATILAMYSHMHLRGKDMTFTAIYPDGKDETLLAIPNYDFNWQLTYYYPHDSKKLPKDTKVEVVAHYDNSAFNTYNPDPSKAVKDGPQTFEEMMYGFFFYTDDSENLNVIVDPKTGKEIERVAEVTK
jgi:hypothetical protein